MKKDFFYSLKSAVVFLIVYILFDFIFNYTLMGIPKYILVFLVYTLVDFFLIRIINK